MSKTIKIAYVNPPKSAKGPGSVKTDKGEYFKVWPTSKHGGATLGDFDVGSTYEVECDEEEYNGKPQYTVRKILSEDFLTGKGADEHGVIETEESGGGSTFKKVTQPTVRSTSTNGRTDAQDDTHIAACMARATIILDGVLGDAVALATPDARLDAALRVGITLFLRK